MENNVVDNIRDCIVKEEELKDRYEKELEELEKWYKIEMRVIETQMKILRKTNQRDLQMLGIYKVLNRSLYDERKIKETNIRNEFIKNKKELEKTIENLVITKLN